MIRLKKRRKKGLILSQNKRQLILYSTIIAILSLVFLLSHLYKYTDLTSFILAIFGITMIIGISFLPCPTKMIKNIIIYIGQNTLVILAFHPILYNGMKPLTIHFIDNSTLDGIFRMAMTWVMLFILIYLFNKYIPFTIGKLKTDTKLT